MRVKLKRPQLVVKIKLRNFLQLQMLLKLFISLIPLILPIIWAVAIFQFSAQSSTESSLLSNTVYNKMPSSILWVFKIIPIRKMAHIIVYMVLSFLTILSINLMTNHPYILTVCLCYTYACLDEIHQKFTLGRGSQFTDTVIDLSGILLCLLLGFVFIFICNALNQAIRNSMRRTKEAL